MRKKTILESPYSGDVDKNIDYAKKCLKDSLDRNECPFASHLLYTQVLNDKDKNKDGLVCLKLLNGMNLLIK